jgi:hypothetical protein
MGASLMTSRVAFCGASGTGKTTLTEWVKTTYSLPINPVGSRNVARAMGFSNAYETDAAGKRSEFQIRLMREKIEWEADHNEFVTDRTTFDNLTYSTLHGCSSIDAAQFEAACTGMNRYECVIYCPVSVFIDLGDDPERLSSMTYQQLYDAALWGLLQKFRPPGTRLVTMPFPKLEHRKDFLRQLLRTGREGEEDS